MYDIFNFTSRFTEGSLLSILLACCAQRPLNTYGKFKTSTKANKIRLVSHSDPQLQVVVTITINALVFSVLTKTIITSLKQLFS